MSYSRSNPMSGSISKPMRILRQALALTLAVTLPVSLALAQQSSIEPVRPEAPVIYRPYVAAEIPPIRPGNSSRFADLIRAGKLYLSARDAIALALENNIDIEVARYGPY